MAVPDPLHPLRVNALELLRQPGTERAISLTVEAEDLAVDHQLLRGDIAVEYRLEALTDGIVVSGTTALSWAGECRRCLEPVEGTDRVEIDEFYQIEVTDEDAFPIENKQLDLAPMTRQIVLLALDDERLCDVDCAGLCPVCGDDRNEGECGCDTTVRDDRWAALDELQLDD